MLDITLRSAMIKNLTTPPRADKYNDEWGAYYGLFQDAAAYIARLYAGTIDYTSDSTVDSHNAMIASLTALHGVIYGNDLTMSDEAALAYWLDDRDNWMDLSEVADPNMGIPDDLKTGGYPELFNYFNLDQDLAYPDEN